MSFLYPLFLFAGLALAIPVLIHLFNLRRYKTILFPHTRFLKNIQLKSQKQSKIRYKWLLAFRLLFLASLILAFAQPFFENNKASTGSALKAIYIDNSGSMTVKDGTRSLLDIAKDAARKQIQKAPPGTRYLLLTNDKPVSYKPLPADKAITEINAIGQSAAVKNYEQVLSVLQNVMQSETVADADLYYYSDFQQNSFAEPSDKGLKRGVHFYGVPLQGEKITNLSIDTAYFDAPALQTGENNHLIVRTSIHGKAPEETPTLQLSVNGQVKNATALNFYNTAKRIDTINFQLNAGNWQQITLSLNDAVKFDDTFRITARSAPNLSVLVLNEGQPNPYIQAAFRAYNGFRLNQVPVSQAPNDLQEYNLVILNGITRLDATLASTLNRALAQGRSVCFFPGHASTPDGLNAGLSQIADIRIDGIDNSAERVTALQPGSALVKDIFEHIPENVQLPDVNWHYTIQAGLSANQQAVMSFRNGDPFLAQFTPTKGVLYMFASAADLQAGNFAASYFFVPFLYQMAMQSHGGDIYAITAGRKQSAFLPLKGGGERNMLHIYGQGTDAIPAQVASGSGVEVFVDPAVTQPGFYALAGADTDTTMLALNSDRTESMLETWNIKDLKNTFKGENYNWINATDAAAASSGLNTGSFPLWKVCVILALLMLAAETSFLAGGLRKPNVATQ